jgi:hypothetical protein
LREEPAIADEGGDVTEVEPEGGEERGDGSFDVVQRVEEAVADVVLELVEELLHGVEFRTVGWELEEVDSIRDGNRVSDGSRPRPR